MIVAICVDNNMGVSFNNRRQSRDKSLIQDLIDFAGFMPIHVQPYSAPLFNGYDVICEEHFSDNNGDSFYFIENTNLSTIEDQIDRLIVYKWNRDYPADTYLGLDLSKWILINSEDIVGNSHPRITREIYKKG